MSIVDCAHVWGIHGTELREEIMYEDEETDSDNGDVMQQ